MQIDGSRQAAQRLAELELPRAATDALERAAAIVETRVVQALSHPPGGQHDMPWLRTGALRDSIGCTAEGTTATIGSTSEVAVDQELGTRSVPPRPFLAPTAAGAAEEAAMLIAQAVSDRITGR